MGRPLKPCGTFAAYTRHKKAGEDPCDACMQAMRDQKNERVVAKRRAAGVARLALVPDVEPDVLPDRLEVARDSLGIVEAALKSPDTPGGSIAGLTRRREELVEKVLALSRPVGEELSAIEQFAARRAGRVADSEG